MTEPTYTFRQGDLPKLDLQIDRGTEFTAWRTQWDSYSSLLGLAKEDAAKQVKALTLCLSRETLAIVHNLGLSEEQMKRPDAVIQAMQEYIDGHVNETVERRNFRRRRQLQGESFDDFLIALCELIKTCKFCSEICAQKNLRDQIIEGLRDAETVEDLLKENNLTLDSTIVKCRIREAARKHCSDITQREPEGMAALQITQQGRANAAVSSGTCSGCGGAWHKGGRQQCPAYNRTCACCHKTGHFAKVCRSRTSSQRGSGQKQASANAILVHPQQQVHMYAITQTRREPAPTIEVQMLSSTGPKNIRVLPDSGAEITAAGKEILAYLDHHPDNLLPSTVIPRAVNGNSMTPIGRIPIVIHLQGKKYTDDLHIIPGITGTVISWEASRSLGILPEHYPKPISNGPAITMVKAEKEGGIPTAQEMIDEFPSVFDGQVRVMDGERFHIALAENAIPFCVKTPRTVPFAYRDKLKAELELLQQQGIIAPVTETTRWCAPIVVTPKKGTDCIRMCVDLSKLNRLS